MKKRLLMITMASLLAISTLTGCSMPWESGSDEKEESKKNDVDDMLDEAKDLMDDEEYKDASKLLQEVLDEDDECVEAYLLLSECYREMGKWDKAEDILLEGIDITDSSKLEKEYEKYFCDEPEIEEPPVEVDPVEVDPVEIDPVEIDPVEVDPDNGLVEGEDYFVVYTYQGGEYFADFYIPDGWRQVDTSEGYVCLINDEYKVFISTGLYDGLVGYYEDSDVVPENYVSAMDEFYYVESDYVTLYNSYGFDIFYDDFNYYFGVTYFISDDYYYSQFNSFCVEITKLDESEEMTLEDAEYVLSTIF